MIFSESAPILESPRHPPARDTLFVLAAIFLFDIFLHPVAGGTGYGLLIIFWALGFRTVLLERRRDVRFLYFMAIALGFRNIWHTGFLPVLLPLVCILIATSIQRRGAKHWMDAGISIGPSELIRHIRGARRLIVHSGGARSILEWVIPILGALLIVMIFGVIFVSANPVVEKLWAYVKEALSIQKFLDAVLDVLIPHPKRLFLWIAAGVITAALLRPRAALIAVKNEEQYIAVDSTNDDSAHVREITGRTSVLAMSAACLLFAGYILIDVNYLLIRAELPEGISDSDYARRGTLWLTLALLLSTLCIGLATAEKELRSRWIGAVSRLARIWVGLDLLMALCVIGRINFYIDISGLTPLRIAGIFGTLMVAAGVVLMGIKIARRKNLTWLIRRYVAVFIIGLTLFALLPRDTISSRYNVSRVIDGDLRPLVLLFRSPMPPEALPEYGALLDHPNPVVANGVATYLAERWSAISDEKRNWRDYQVAHARTISVLENLAPRLVQDRDALFQLARACGGLNDGNQISEAWKTGQRSDLEWIDD